MAQRINAQNFSDYTDQIRAQWPELTEADIDYIANDRQKLVGKIQERYPGLTSQTAEQQLVNWEGTLTVPGVRPTSNRANQPQPGRDIAAPKVAPGMAARPPVTGAELGGPTPRGPGSPSSPQSGPGFSGPKR